MQANPSSIRRATSSSEHLPGKIVDKANPRNGRQGFSENSCKFVDRGLGCSANTIHEKHESIGSTKKHEINIPTSTQPLDCGTAYRSQRKTIQSRKKALSG